MREPVERVIGEHTYTVTPLPAGVGLKVLTRVGKTLGPALGRVSSLEDAVGALGAGLSTALENLDPTELEVTCKDFAKYTQVSAPSGGMVPLDKCFDLHFAGDYLGLFGWLAFCAEVNFGPLLAGLKAKGTAAGLVASDPPGVR